MPSSAYMERRPVRSPAGAGAPVLGPSRQVALAIQERCPPAAVAEWFDLLSQGIDPNATIDKESGKRTGFVPPDWNTRLKARLELVNRGYGKLKSHVVLEGEVGVNANVQVDARVAVATFALDARDIAGAMDARELGAFRETQRKLIAAAKRKVELLTAGRGGGDVVDVESEP